MSERDRAALAKSFVRFHALHVRLADAISQFICQMLISRALRKEDLKLPKSKRKSK